MTTIQKASKLSIILHYPKSSKICWVGSIILAKNCLFICPFVYIFSPPFVIVTYWAPTNFFYSICDWFLIDKIATKIGANFFTMRWLMGPARIFITWRDMSLLCAFQTISKTWKPIMCRWMYTCVYHSWTFWINSLFSIALIISGCSGLLSFNLSMMHSVVCISIIIYILMRGHHSIHERSLSDYICTSCLISLIIISKVRINLWINVGSRFLLCAYKELYFRFKELYEVIMEI